MLNLHRRAASLVVCVNQLVEVIIQPCFRLDLGRAHIGNHLPHLTGGQLDALFQLGQLRGQHVEPVMFQ